MSYIIGIAGESGVGKSTLTKVIQLFYGVENTTVISSDDLHKWERGNQVWDTMTHLSPSANNLELGDFHLKSLLSGKFIYRSIYNHKTGTFNAPKKIYPNKVVINEGLHAFYTKKSQSYTNLKIFIDTEENLRIHWKIIRDTENRGYKYNDVLDTINKRKVDASIINKEQSDASDIKVFIKSKNTIKNVGDRHEKIEIQIEISETKQDSTELVSFIKGYNDAIKALVELSAQMGGDIEKCQASGGNISIKVRDKMIIKSSGIQLKDVSYDYGYSTVEYLHMLNVRDAKEYDSILNSNYFFIGERPSMEVGFHALLKKYVIHIHPIYLTALLCRHESEQIIKSLYSDLDYIYIPYSTPGYSLYESIKDISKERTYDVYFLENHGIIVNSDDLLEIHNKINYIINVAKKYVTHKYETFNLELMMTHLTEKIMFPDAAVLYDNVEVVAANNYICYVSDGTDRPLTKENLVSLLMMESEKYRKDIHK